MMKKVNLSQKFDQIQEFWSPRIVGELNGQAVKIAKIKGDFVWHTHKNEAEFFLVIKGKMVIRLRERDIQLEEGEFFVVPRGVEHKPVAEQEAHILMFEPMSTLNTGEVLNKRTIDKVERI
jgi:mannose-6-phosphate isomerase-like protein (cupin superfamily)